MRKLDALREVMTRIPQIKADPSKLALFADRGRIAARAGSLSFVYRYTATMVVEDFAGDIDTVIVPLLAWIAVHQPELMQKADSEPFGFEAEVLAGDLIDLSITIELSERVRVERAVVAGKPGTNTVHLDDNIPPDAFPGAEGARLWTGIADDLVAQASAVVVPD